ncbi:MAG: hypothetical protein H7832_12100 [Magnetococcus sp. DMHC-6]
MCPIAIPDWTAAGVLPPTDKKSHSTISRDRSPYRVSLIELMQRFATSPERSQILDKFLHYRAKLHSIGLIKGFQWLNGSFMENVEFLENRSPNDLDVVTFYDLPDKVKDQGEFYNQNSDIFQHDNIKRSFQVDGYFCQLSGIDADSLVENATYWYSLWSHRRTGDWKGYLQIDLAPNEDEMAKQRLDSMRGRGGAL